MLRTNKDGCMDCHDWRAELRRIALQIERSKVQAEGEVLGWRFRALVAEDELRHEALARVAAEARIALLEDDLRTRAGK